MSNDKGRTTLEQLIERLLDEALGPGVHAGSGFIQNEDARVCERGTRNRQQLTLSLREARAAFSQYCLIFLRQTFDERIGVSKLDGSHHFFVSRVWSSEADVFHDRGTEQECIL